MSMRSRHLFISLFLSAALLAAASSALVPFGHNIERLINNPFGLNARDFLQNQPESSVLQLEQNYINSFFFISNLSHTVNTSEIGLRSLNNTDDDFETAVNLEASRARYWALSLLVVPALTIFGNILVVLAVYKEKSLRNVTNFFVVSLAIADLTVASAVMPFAVYYEVTQHWHMSNMLCDAWVATDVMASTASILNLVAIAVDRYIAVTQPIKYARHKNSNRVYVMIGLVWFTSMAIASPIVLGFNDMPNREQDQCSFNNEQFLVYSSLFSFYIPTVIMIFLYYRIFRVIRTRAKKSHNKPDARASSQSHSQSGARAKLVLITSAVYKLKNSEQQQQQASSTPKEESPVRDDCRAPDGKGLPDDSALVDSSKLTAGTGEARRAQFKKSSKTKLIATVNILRAQAASSNNSSNKERKVTKTLAIVLIVFLVCWSPFFAINNIGAGVCKYYKLECSFLTYELISFLTWLGYVNSLLNPIIYTIFNIEFRKAFAKILFSCLRSGKSPGRQLV
nr:G protein-coupled receptor [Proales similis]